MRVTALVTICAFSAWSCVAGEFPLACEGGAFETFNLKNLNQREFRDVSGDQCRLTAEAQGVIWVAKGEGLALRDAEKKLTFTDDQGRQFSQVCWTRSGGINNVKITEMLLAGPADSKSVKVCCGEACASAKLE